MSASRKKTKGSNSRRTKDQLLQELEIAQRLLVEKEEGLILCQEELAHMIQDQNEPLPTTDLLDTPEIALEQIEALEIEINRLEESLAESNKALKKSQKRVDELTKSEQLDELNRSQEAKNKQTAPALPQPASSTDSEIAVISATQPLTTVPINIAPFVDIIQENEPFTASISIDLTRISETSTKGLHCNTKLFAKRLSDGWSGIIGEDTIFYDGLTSMTAQLENLALPEGLYILQATVSFSSIDGNPVPISALHEGEILQIVG